MNTYGFVAWRVPLNNFLFQALTVGDILLMVLQSVGNIFNVLRKINN